jgi:hypothetical protein
LKFSIESIIGQSKVAWCIEMGNHNMV